MDLCVVIPARNEERLIGEQLDALRDQQWAGDWEIIVVDNASTDRTAVVADRYTDHLGNLRLVHAPDRPDKAYAIAQAISATDAPAVAICDADDIVAEGWVAAIGEALRQHDVVTGPNELERLNAPWLASSRGRSIEHPVGTFGGIFPCIRGNNYGTRIDVLSRIGPPLVDGVFPLEDVEFSLRCWLNGIDIVGVPAAVVHYRYRSTAGDLWRQGWAYGSRRPVIARLLKEHGKPRPPHLSGWKSWVMLVLTLPTIVTGPGRARWLWTAGNRLGQVAGSVRHRIVML